MTRFLDPSFSTYAPGNQDYRDNWDRIFKKDADGRSTGESAPVPACELCGTTDECLTGTCLGPRCFDAYACANRRRERPQPIASIRECVARYESGEDSDSQAIKDIQALVRASGASTDGGNAEGNNIHAPARVPEEAGTISRTYEGVCSLCHKNKKGILRSNGCCNDCVPYESSPNAGAALAQCTCVPPYRQMGVACPVHHKAADRPCAARRTEAGRAYACGNLSGHDGDHMSYDGQRSLRWIHSDPPSDR